MTSRDDFAPIAEGYLQQLQNGAPHVDKSQSNTPKSATSEPAIPKTKSGTAIGKSSALARLKRFAKSRRRGDGVPLTAAPDASEKFARVVREVEAAAGLRQRMQTVAQALGAGQDASTAQQLELIAKALTTATSKSAQRDAWLVLCALQASYPNARALMRFTGRCATSSADRALIELLSKAAASKGADLPARLVSDVIASSKIPWHEQTPVGGSFLIPWNATVTVEAAGGSLQRALEIECGRAVGAYTIVAAVADFTMITRPETLTADDRIIATNAIPILRCANVLLCTSDKAAQQTAALLPAFNSYGYSTPKVTTADPAELEQALTDEALRLQAGGGEHG